MSNIHGVDDTFRRKVPVAGRKWAIALLLILVSTVGMLLLGPVGAWRTSRTARESATADQQVLETVLRDLLTYTGDDSPVAIKRSAPKQLVLSTRAAVYRQAADEVLYRHQKQRWDKLTPAELASTREAAEHLVQRIGAHDLFTPFQPKDGRLLVRDDAHGSEGREELLDRYDRPIRAWPPGFSRDRNLCIVRLVIPWSIHHAEATYILAKRSARWVVLLRQFVYYV